MKIKKVRRLMAVSIAACMASAFMFALLPTKVLAETDKDFWYMGLNKSAASKQVLKNVYYAKGKKLKAVKSIKIKKNKLIMTGPHYILIKTYKDGDYKGTKLKKCKGRKVYTIKKDAEYVKDLATDGYDPQKLTKKQFIKFLKTFKSRTISYVFDGFTMDEKNGKIESLQIKRYY